MTGCPSLNLQSEAPDAVIACDNNAQCPADTTCALRIGRCLPAVSPDTDAPTAEASVDPTLLFRGAATVVTVVVSEPLGTAPVLSLTRSGGADVTTTLQSGSFADGDTTFAFAFTVDATESASQLTPVVSLVDRFNNGVDLTLDAVAVDVAGPVVLAANIVVAFNGNEALGQTHASSQSVLSVTVTIDEADARAVAARVLQGQNVVGAFTAPTDGTVSTFQPLTLPTLTSTAELVVEVDATDRFGNQSTGRSTPIPVDLTPPTLSIGDVLIDGVNAADVSLITSDTATVTLAHAGDAIAWCAHLIETGGCDRDGDFVATDDTVTVTMPAVAGRQHLGVVVRDRALLRAALTHDLFTTPPGVPLTTFSIGAPVGQQDVKVGDIVSVDGATLPGATATAVFVDADNGDALTDPAPIAVASGGAFSARLVVPVVVTDGLRLAVDVRMSFAGVVLPPVRSRNTLRADTTPPGVTIGVVGGLLQATSTIAVSWSIVGAQAVVVDGDIVTSGVVDVGTSTSGIIAVTLSPGNGERTVRFTVRDVAGQQTSTQLTVVVNTDLPAVNLLARNIERATDGVRPGSLVDFDGTTDLDAVVQSGRLIFFDNANAELTACQQPVAFVLRTGVGANANIAVDAPVTVGTCPTATRVQAELIVRNAVGLTSVPEASRAGVDIDNDNVIDAVAFAYDDTAPVVQSLAFDINRNAPPGLDAIVEVRGGVDLLVAPSSSVILTVSATDARAVQAIVGVAASRSGGQSFALPAAAQALSLVGADGDKVIDVTVEDDVGNATVVTTTIVLDTTAPAAPNASALSYRESSVDGSGNDATSTFTITGAAAAAEALARVGIFGPGENAAIASLGTPASANAAGAFNAVDITGLGAPVQTVQLVAVDRAGHRSAVTTITRPRFTPTKPAVALGPTGAAIAIAVGAGTLAGSPTVTVTTSTGTAVAGTVGDVVVSGSGTAFSAALRLDLGDGLLQGNDAAIVRVAGAGPGLDGASLSFDTVAIDVDFTAPVVNASLLRLTDLGTSFDVQGRAGAVSDRAGVDVRSVTGLAVSANGAGGSSAADGTFTIVGNGALPELVDVSVVDGAGNASNTVTLRAPVVAAITPSAGVLAVNDVLTITFTVDDEQTLAADPVVLIGGRSATRVSAVTVSTTTTFAYSLLVQNDGNGGLQALRITATDSSGHGRVVDVANVVTFDLPNPDSDGDGVCDGPVAVASVCSAGPDADTDGDGICDGSVAVESVCSAGPDANPNDACVPVAGAGCDGCGVPNPSFDAGILFERKSVVVDGLTRTFGVRYPDGYDQNRPYPITLVFHGDLTCVLFSPATDECLVSRQAAQEVRGLFKLESVVDEANNNAVVQPGLSQDSILVYPETRNQNQFNPEFFSWDTFSDAADNADIQAVLAIKSQLRREVCVDDATTVAIGFSGGGFFAHTLGCKTNIISAVATFAGGFEDGDAAVSQDPRNAINFNTCVASPRALLIHGKDDTTVPVRYADQAAAHYAEVFNCEAVSPVTSTTLPEPDECEDFVGCTSPVSVCRVPGCVQENPDFDPAFPNDPLQPFCLVDDQHNPWQPQGPQVIRAFLDPIISPIILSSPAP